MFKYFPLYIAVKLMCWFNYCSPKMTNEKLAWVALVCCFYNIINLWVLIYFICFNSLQLLSLMMSNFSIFRQGRASWVWLLSPFDMLLIKLLNIFFLLWFLIWKDILAFFLYITWLKVRTRHFFKELFHLGGKCVALEMFIAIRFIIIVLETELENFYNNVFELFKR